MLFSVVTDDKRRHNSHKFWLGRFKLDITRTSQGGWNITGTDYRVVYVTQKFYWLGSTKPQLT